MVYPEILRFIVATGIIILSTILLTPIIHTFWADNLKAEVNTSTSLGKQLSLVGDLLDEEFRILGFVVAGIVFAWGVATAARKGTLQQQEDYEV